MEKSLYELTTPQKSIWHTENYYSGTNINNVCGVLTINEPVNFEILNNAIQLFIKNNDVYHTKFIIQNDKLMQYVDDYEPTEIELLSLSSEKEMDLMAQKMANTPFNFLDSFLFEFKMFKLPNNHGGFIINNHHIISDSWNLGIMGNEIVTYYSCLLNNNSQEIENIENPSYIDYIISEKEYKNSKKFEKDKDYWNSLFQTVPDIATIPSQYANNANSINANRKLYSIPQNLMCKISDYASLNKISLFNFFMAIYSIYLGRVSNLNDFCIGTPVLNRSNFKEKNTCGMFVNVLPLRIQIDDALDFKTFATNIAQDSLSLLRHQKYGYETILEDLRAKNTSLPSLYNIVVSYQITKITENQDQIPHTSNWIFDNCIADDIDIHLFDLNDNNLNIAYDYKVSKYTESEIEKIHNRILYVISQIVDNNVNCLKDLEIVTPEEKNQILTLFNNTKIAYPYEKTIIELFEEQVKKHSNEIAINFENEELTYGELNEKVNQLAHLLKLNYQIKNGDIVGLFIDKSLEMIIGMLAILKSGACFLPLDFELPVERLTYIISNSNPSLILTSHKLCEMVKSLNVSYLEIDLDSSFIYGNNANKDNLEISITPEDLIYIIYTSGSTGTPKGVMVKQRNIVRLVKNPNFLNFKEHEIMVQTGTIVFDACIFEIFGALLNGFKLHILPKARLMDFSYMKSFIKEKQISILFLTTGLLNQLINEDPSIFASVRYLLTGGDVISPKHIAKVTSACPKVQIINCYGPTENGSYSTCYQVSGNEKDGIIPIGKPISNSTCYVVSKTGTLQPIGVPGELWVGGDGIARGYINNYELTKQKFVKNPFGEGIIYKTGDQVKWLPDGNLVFLTRLDKQIKLRGYRIELEDIDTNILKYNGIKQSISILIELNNQKAICSYIIADEQININNLKAFVADYLPKYMIPKYILQVESLPLTISGKLDRRSLPIPAFEEDKIVPARNLVDECIINKICNMFKLKQISIDSSFFDIGGDSLSAISLSTYLSTKYNLSISVKDIFEHSVIKDLSDYISCNLTNNKEIITISKVTKKEYYPISSAQKRIYYASSMDTNSLLYNISGGLIFDKIPDVNKLENCIRILINRHESFRTSFTLLNDEIVQKVKNDIDFNLIVEKQNDSSIEDLFKEFVKPFDLSKAPLFRTKLLNLKDNHSLLLLDMHHIISDGTSLTIFIKELCDLYNEKELPEKQIDYTDFAVWEKEQFNRKEFAQARDFWLKQYKDEIPLLNMPTTYARPSVQSFEGSNYYINLNRDIFDNINNVSKKLKITPYMLMLSVFYVLLSKYTSQDDIVVGTPIVGRELPELSNVLGMFVNTLALRNTVNHNASFEDFANNIRNYCLSAFKNQTYPFDELVKQLNIKRDASRNPLFDIMFIYQNNGYPEIDFKGIKSKYFIPDNNISKFDLSLEIIPFEDKLSLRFEYCTKLFDKNFIERFASHYINILNSILKDANTKIADIDMLSEEEKKQILYNFNNTTVDYPRDKTIVDLFEKQVEETPNNIAVVFEDQKLTYRELNEKANQLARYLIENGVTNNSIVGIMLPRSLEIMVAFLAVLKTGACYIPIDQSFPNERIEYMLENSNAIILLKLNDTKEVNFQNTINIDINNSIYTNCGKNNLCTNINPDNPSYIIYTSGSTGKPKGVILTHNSLMNLTCYLNNVVDYFKTGQNIAIASITTMSFDIFLFETIISLQKGLKVVIANEAQQTNPNLLDDLIYKYDIKAIQMTPSRMEIFINNKEYMPHLSNLKYITLAGEALPNELRNKLLSLGNITIYNGYGPSETTVFSTFTNVTKYRNVNIGKPLANTYAYILDKDKHLCPVGIPGELYISGDGVGKGYINNKDLTDKSFVQDIFNPNFIMYKTGDLVRFLPNGELDYISRIDNQVKIRGLRIELDEIEKWIMKYDYINKVVLSSSTDKNGRQYLIAYITVNNRISINELKIYLSKHIPKYMIPTHFIVLDEFPYLPNGKINKKALPLPNENVSSNKKFIAPTNSLEIKICQIFENLLSVSPISIYDNFFDIGGDSLLAMALQLELLKLNIHINYSDIFIYPTVKDLANYISSNSKKSLTRIDANEVNNFDSILKNSITMPTELKYNSLGNILLTGVTGFLGVHILSSILTNENSKVYCLIRTEPGLTIEQKLLNKLHYYFDKKYDNLIGTRIIPVQADITVPNFGLSQSTLNKLSDEIDIVINSAAKVSHYGNYSDYKKINVDGTQNLVDFCLKNNKRFYQISTLSVSGNSFIDDSYIKQDFESDIDFNENNFYINQSLDNVYIRSKFEAEKIVLNNILNGLDGYILRVGNLMNRFTDGKFQPNVNENAYINRLISYYKIGCIPNYLLDGYLELTPVDCCANAILKILQYNSKTNRIFHLLNHKTIDIYRFINILNKFYDKISIVNNETFLKTIDKILNNPYSNDILSGIINDFDENRKIVYSSPVKIKSGFSIKYLNKVGFDWPELDEDYIKKFLDFFYNLNYFKRKDDV